MSTRTDPTSRSLERALSVAACAAAVVAFGSANNRAPSTTAPLFVDAAEQSGLHFIHDNGATGQWYMPEILGAGAALFDYDNDGDLDVYLVQGAQLDAAARPTTGNRLFRNDGMVAGRLHFTDVTERAGVGLKACGMGVAVGDIDNDGWLDIYVTNFGSNALFRNRGDGTFVDITREAGVDDPRWSTSAAFLDYDRDGDLDLFVANYVAFTVAGNKVCTYRASAREYCPPAAYAPVPARLFRNEGGLRFTDVTESSGIARAFGAGLGVAVGDFDGDGWPDIYVANDATPNQLWMNRRDGTFEERGLLSGTAFNALGRPEGSMGIALGDADNDGDEDLFVTNVAGESHVLYINDGRGNFEDARVRTGVAAPTAAMTGFGTGWLDYDHDGRLDLFVADGAVSIIESQRGDTVPYRQRKQLLHNEGGAHFREVPDAGPEFERLDVARAAAFGDIDNDGDIDVLVTNNNAPVRLLLNQTISSAPRKSESDGSAAAIGSPAARHWLEISLRTDGTNRFGVGARVGVLRTGQPTLWRRARSDGSYLSASDGRVQVGLGPSRQIDAVVVDWPDGMRESFTGVKPDRIVTLRRGEGQVRPGTDTR